MRVLLVHHIHLISETQYTIGAVEYHRMYKPHHVLNKLHPEYDYSTANSIHEMSDDELKKFNLILFCRVINRPDETKERLNKLGIKFGLDLDDYWHLDKFHILYESYQNNNTPALIVKSIAASHFVICTTSILADKIKPLNKNVYVIENGIDTSDDTWKPKRTYSDRVRFGFTQGSTHQEDIGSIAADVAFSINESAFYHHGQVVLCGYEGKHTVSVAYEKLLTRNFKPLQRFHMDYVLDLMNESKKELRTDLCYRRIWRTDIDTFGNVYNEFDISVAPLLDTEFNNCKSNLKMLEAGFKGCAVMVSEVNPYTPLATKENSFLLSEKSFKGWQRYILSNPEIIKEKAHYLSRDIRPYSLQNLTTKRKQIYDQLT